MGDQLISLTNHKTKDMTHIFKFVKLNRWALTSCSITYSFEDSFSLADKINEPTVPNLAKEHPL